MAYQKLLKAVLGDPVDGIQVINMVYDLALNKMKPADVWEEYHAAHREAYILVNSMPDKQFIIVHRPTGIKMPNGALPQMRMVMTLLPPNVRWVFPITNDMFATIMMNNVIMVRRAFRRELVENSKKLIICSSEADYQNQFRKVRAQSQTSIAA